MKDKKKIPALKRLWWGTVPAVMSLWCTYMTRSFCVIQHPIWSNWSFKIIQKSSYEEEKEKEKYMAKIKRCKALYQYESMYAQGSLAQQIK